jgi:hypothetical protein
LRRLCACCGEGGGGGSRRETDEDDAMPMELGSGSKTDDMEVEGVRGELGQSRGRGSEGRLW